MLDENRDKSIFDLKVKHKINVQKGIDFTLEILMKAIICTNYGLPDVLKLQNVDKPIPEKNQVLIKIYAVPVTTADRRLRSSIVPSVFAWIMMRLIFGLTRPRQPILGWWLAGEIESTGKNVKKFKAGDQVYAYAGMGLGGYAQYICLSEKSVMGLKPSNVSYEEAAAVPFGGITALYFLKKANIQAGQKVLIYGASGATGNYAVQLAKYFGAEVTGVCSTRNLDLVTSLGAAKVIDYTKEDFTKTDEKFDIVFDAVGKITIKDGKKILKQNGKYISALTSGLANVTMEGLVQLTKLVEEGKIKPLIDSIRPFEEMAEAHRYADKGHTRGNVVIKVEHNN